MVGFLREEVEEDMIFGVLFFFELELDLDGELGDWEDWMYLIMLIMFFGLDDLVMIVVIFVEVVSLVVMILVDIFFVLREELVVEMFVMREEMFFIILIGWVFGFVWGFLL